MQGLLSKEQRDFVAALKADFSCLNITLELQEQLDKAGKDKERIEHALFIALQSWVALTQAQTKRPRKSKQEEGKAKPKASGKKTKAQKKADKELNQIRRKKDFELTMRERSLKRKNRPPADPSKYDKKRHSNVLQIRAARDRKKRDEAKAEQKRKQAVLKQLKALPAFNNPRYQQERKKFEEVLRSVRNEENRMARPKVKAEASSTNPKRPRMKDPDKPKTLAEKVKDQELWTGDSNSIRPVKSRTKRRS